MNVVYSLYNAFRNKIYIGQTENLENRLKRHNSELPTKINSFTKINNGKWIIVYSEKCTDRKQAKQRESQLKSAKGREFIWQIIKKKQLVAVAQW